MSSNASRLGRHRLLHAALSISLAAALPGAAQAARINYEIGASLLRSDNLNLSETNEIDETVFSPFLRFDAQQTGSKFQLKARGSLQYLHYLGDEFDDEWRGEFVGEANWTILPERIDFVFQDYLTRQPINVLNSFSPGNQQQINVFVTGPTFYARFGDTTRGQLDLRYSNSHAQDDEDFNSDRYNVATRLLHELSDTKRISGNLEATRVDYDLNGSIDDYTRYDAYATYTSTFKAFDFTLDGGYSRIDPEVGEEHSAPLVRGTLTWRVSPRSTFNGGLNYEFADAAQDLVSRASVTEVPDIDDDDPTDLPDVQPGPDVYKLRRLEAGYQFVGERLSLQIQPFYQSIRYVDNNSLDQTAHGAYLSLAYKLRPRLTLSFAASADTREFDQQSREDDDRFFNIGLNNQFTRHWSGQIDFQHRTRDSNSAGQSYDENAAIVSFTYRR